MEIVNVILFSSEPNLFGDKSESRPEELLEITGFKVSSLYQWTMWVCSDRDQLLTCMVLLQIS